MKAFFVSIPHSGEKVPDEVTWLRQLEEPLLMCDVDRYVDALYLPAIKAFNVPHIIAEWHRYVVDLNRLPEDVDQDSVLSSENASGAFTTGLHWVQTTKGQKLMPTPITQELHQQLVEKYYNPFHQAVRDMYKGFFEQGAKKVYHLDAHSMPSLGTSAHRDPGEIRAEIVISDSDGKSCEPAFLELVVESYRSAGFEVKINWPYKGGRITQAYGQPRIGQHAIQVEMNRKIYMDEETKKMNTILSVDVKNKINKAIERISNELPSFK